MNEGRVSECAEYSLHTVFDRQYKTGGQLPQPASGIHEGRGVRQKFKLGHYLVKQFLQFFDAILIAAEFFFGFSDVAGDPLEHLIRRLGDLAPAVFFQIPSAKDPSGIFRENQAVF